MSALNIVKQHNEIHVVTDGCHYDNDGNILSFGPKAWPIAHFPGFVAVVGRTVAGPLFATTICQFATNVDELFDGAEDIVRTLDATFADLLGDGLGQAAIGGWSDERQQMRIAFITGGACRHTAPYTMTEYHGDQILCSPPLTPDLQNKMFGGMFSSIQEALPAENFAKKQITAQRQMTFKLPSGREGHGIGGFAQLLTVTRDSVSTKIVARFPDEAGGHLEPEPIDWATFRRESDATAGMSKLKRDMLMKKMAKGKLRAA